MPGNERDRSIVEHMLRYCREVETAHDDFGHSRERFDHSTTYQNAISMCIMQIGELVNHLSEEFRSLHGDIPWHKIRGMRNYVAHEYGTIDFDVVWYVSNDSIRELKAFCEDYLLHQP